MRYWDQEKWMSDFFEAKGEDFIMYPTSIHWGGDGYIVSMEEKNKIQTSCWKLVFSISTISIIFIVILLVQFFLLWAYHTEIYSYDFIYVSLLLFSLGVCLTIIVKKI